MKKIGLLIDSMIGAGAQRVVSHLSYILGDKYDVHVIFFEDTYKEYPCGGTIHNMDVPATDGSPLVKVGLLRRRIKGLEDVVRREKLECVISFLDSPNFVNLLASLPGCRKIISIRNYPADKSKQGTVGKLKDSAMKLLYRRADCVVAVSRLIEQVFRDRYGVADEKLCTIYNPYNFEEMRQKGEESLTPEEQAFYDGNFVFANVGRIMYQKGIWHLVKAFSLVHKAHPEARLVVIGEDFSKDRLVPLVRDLGLQEQVLLTGRSRNPYKYLTKTDCYVLSSFFEGFPNAMAEAMACGCAIVATDCKSGPREILCENPDLNAVIHETQQADYGVLVPVPEAEENWDASVITDGERELAKAMSEMLTDPLLCREYAQKAEERSRAFGLDVCAQKFSQAIEG